MPVPARVVAASACLGLALWSAPAAAQDPVSEEGTPLRQDGRFGLGLGVANRTGIGISGKYFFDKDHSLQAVVALRDLGWQEGEAISLSVDYLFEMAPLFEDPSVELAWAWGGGVFGGVASGEENGVSYTRTSLGLAGVIGIEVLVRPMPFDFVLEYRPSAGFGRRSISDDAFNIDLVAFGLHARYFF